MWHHYWYQLLLNYFALCYLGQIKDVQYWLPKSRCHYCNFHEKLEYAHESLCVSKTRPVIRPKKRSRSVRKLKDFSEMTGLAIVLLGGFISGESSRLRPAVSHVNTGFLGGGFFVFRSFGDGWLTRETLTRGLIERSR
jgi:hypothetical protein